MTSNLLQEIIRLLIRLTAPKPDPKQMMWSVGISLILVFLLLTGAGLWLASLFHWLVSAQNITPATAYLFLGTLVFIGAGVLCLTKKIAQKKQEAKKNEEYGLLNQLCMLTEDMADAFVDGWQHKEAPNPNKDAPKQNENHSDDTHQSNIHRLKRKIRDHKTGAPD